MGGALTWLHGFFKAFDLREWLRRISEDGTLRDPRAEGRAPPARDAWNRIVR